MTRAEKTARALATDHLTADLGRRTARGSVIARLAQAIRLALRLASVAIMARLLAPEDFGVVAMATTVTAFVGLLDRIVTSRLEKYRPETEARLAANGLSFNHLHMLDLPTASEQRRWRAHASFEAEVFRRADSRLFVESEPWQAD